MTRTRPPPTHQPVVAAITGLSVWKPTPGMQRQSSGRSDDVGAGGESTVARRTDDGDALIRGVEFLHRLLQLDRDGGGDRVQLLRPVDAQDGDWLRAVRW